MAKKNCSAFLKKTFIQTRPFQNIRGYAAVILVVKVSNSTNFSDFAQKNFGLGC